MSEIRLHKENINSKPKYDSLAVEVKGFQAESYWGLWRPLVDCARAMPRVVKISE